MNSINEHSLTNFKTPICVSLLVIRSSIKITKYDYLHMPTCNMHINFQVDLSQLIDIKQH